MDQSRRAVLRGLVDDFLEAGVARKAGARPCLVCVFQRGAADGLSMLVPYGEPNYYASRPTLAVPPPGVPGGALDLDGQFGLHPGLSALKAIYDAGDVAFIHAAGLATANRSHFDAQRRMELGDVQAMSGWLGRHLAATAAGDDSPFRAVAIAAAPPRSTAGPVRAVALPSLDAFSFPPPLLEMLTALNGGSGSVPAMAQITLEALGTLSSIQPSAIAPDNGAVYPRGGFGQTLMRAAQLIKAEVGSEVICVDMGGWDTHAGQAASLANLYAELSETLAAFHTDLGRRMEDVIVVAMSEFGRTLRENASLGTDHGWGGAMMLMGGGVRGRRVFAEWTGLEPDALDRNGDLPVTIDFRRVLHELLDRRFENPDADSVFAGYRHDGDLGIF